MDKALWFIIFIIIVVILIAIAVYIVYQLQIEKTDIYTACAKWNNEYNCEPESYAEITGLLDACEEHYDTTGIEAFDLCLNLCRKNCNPFAVGRDEGGGEFV